MVQLRARTQDEVAYFLREARSSADRTQATLEVLSSARAAAAERMALHAPHWRRGAADVFEELVARDEALAAATDELREQIDALACASRLLEQERSKYMDLFAHAPDAYVITDLHGVTHEANIAAGVLFSSDLPFLAGRPLISFVARQDTRAFRGFLRELAGAAEPLAPRAMTLRMRARGQPVFVAGVRATVVRTASGKPLALRWAIHPFDPGETRSKGRLADAELAATMVEKLRAPLESIVSLAGALANGSVLEEGELQQTVAWIRQSAAAQQSVLEELAELADVCGDKAVPPAEVIDLRATVRKVIAAVEPSEPDRVSFLDRGPDALVRAEPSRFVRALTLLLRRGLDGTPRDGGALLVHIQASGGEATVNIEAPEAARVAPGAAIWATIAARIFEAYGGRLMLRDDSPSVSLRLPIVTR